MQTIETSSGSDILKLLERYFTTWSAGDMEGYKALFHEQATIIQVGDGDIYTLGRDEFVEQQTPEPQDTVGRREWMTSWAINEDAVVAEVIAGYELDFGSGTARGVDRFTLMRGGAGQWIKGTPLTSYFPADRAHCRAPLRPWAYNMGLTISRNEIYVKYAYHHEKEASRLLPASPHLYQCHRGMV